MIALFPWQFCCFVCRLEGKDLTIEGDGLQYRDFVHVKDIARGIVRFHNYDSVCVSYFLMRVLFFVVSFCYIDIGPTKSERKSNLDQSWRRSWILSQRRCWFSLAKPSAFTPPFKRFGWYARGNLSCQESTQLGGAIQFHGRDVENDRVIQAKQSGFPYVILDAASDCWLPSTVL